MGMAFYVMIGSGLLLTAFALLLRAEAVNGRRLFLRQARQAIDLKLFERSRQWQIWKQYLGASSLRLFLHYLLHQVLSSILFIIRRLEKLLSRLRKHNRAIAKDVKNVRRENHLSHIAAHKVSTALSPEEQAALRERTLND